MSQMKISPSDEEAAGARPGIAANEGRPGALLTPQSLPRARRSVSPRHTIFVAAIILSLLWLAACAGFVAMQALAGQPLKLDAITMASAIAGASMPLVVIWLIALYLRSVAEARVSQALLSNPAAFTSQQVSAMSSSIGESAHKLSEAAEIAHNRIAEIEDGMARHTSRLLDVAETAVRNADYVKAQLKSQNDTLIALIKDMTAKSDQIEAIMSTATSNLFGATDAAVVKAEQAGTLLATHAGELVEATKRAESLTNGIEASFSNSAELIRGASNEVDQAFSASMGKMRDATKQANDEVETIGKALAEHSLSLTVAADHAADRAGFIARRLQKEIEELGEIADQVSDRTDQISASFANQGKAITDAAADFEHLAGQINVTADEARRKLEDETRSHAREMQRVSEAAAEKAREAVRVFSDEAGVLETRSDGIIERVGLAGMAFAEQASRIDEATSDAVDKASARMDQARVKLDEHLARLTRVSELSEALTNSLSTKFASYVDQLSAATDQAASEAEVIGSSFKASGESLMDVTRQVGERTNEFKQELELERDQIERLAREMRAQSSEMQTAMRAHAHDMGETAERAATWAETANKAFRHQTQDMSESAENASRRLMEQYATNARTMTDAAQTAVDKVVSGIEEKIRDHSKEVAWISEQAAIRAEETLSGILGETRKFSAQTDAQFIELVDRFTSMVREQANAMAEAAQGANDRIELAGTDFKTRAGEIEQAATGVADKLSAAATGAAQTIEQASSSFDDRAGTLQETASGVAGKLTEAAENASKIVDQTTAQFGERAARIEEAADTIATRVTQATDDALQLIGRAEKDFRVHAEGLEQTADGLVGKIAGASESIGSTMSEAAENAARQIEKVGSDFREEAGNIERTAEQVAAHIATKLDEARALLDRHSELLNTASANAARDVSASGDEFARQARELESVSNASRDQLSDIAAALRDEMATISNMADGIADRVKTVIGELAEQDSGLKGAADQAVAHLNAAGNMLEKRAADLNEKSATAREEIARVGDLFDQKILAMARSASSVKTGLLNAGKSLDESATELDNRTRNVTHTIRTAEEGLRQEMELLRSESNATLQNLQEAAEATKRQARDFAEHSAKQALQKSGPNPDPIPARGPAPVVTPAKLVSSPSKGTDALSSATQSFLSGAKLAMREVARTGDPKLTEDSRNTLLTSAAYVVECVEGLEVDTLEIFDRPIPADYWERYLSGEETLMSHADVTRGSRKTRALIRHRYATDTRFKAAVSSYLTWFQDEVGASKGLSKAELTSKSRLFGSEMGTLYALLHQSVTLRL